METKVSSNVEVMRTDIANSQQNALSFSTKESEVSNMLQVIARCAQDPNVDINKMTALRDMRDQELTRLKEESFAMDYVSMKDELPRIIKGKDNLQTKSKYAPLEDINNIVDPILKKYGFATSTPIKSQTATSVTVEAILMHKSGHKERTEITLPLDMAGIAGTVNKTPVHGISSSIMYARRVALCSLLNISTGDDLDGNSPNAVNKNKSSFGENVKNEAVKTQKPVSKPKPEVKSEEKEPIWDKKTIHLLDGKNIQQEFKSSEDAGQQLLKQLKGYETKKDRLSIINLNMPIMRALIKKGNGELIDSIHKFVDEGK